MRQGRASRTAEHNALFRALETRRRHGLFRDPLAEAFLSPSLRVVAWLGRVPPLHAVVTRVIDGRWPGVRTSVVARTRLIDDAVVELSSRVGQVVVLGAGYDTRPYRLGDLAPLPVYEVDHPDTQRAKQRVLAHRGVASDRVRFVATDFRLGTLGASLAEAGFGGSVATLFLWEGVTNYLDEAAVDATLRWCAEAAAGSRLLFTYVDRRVLTEPERFAGVERLHASLRRAGEELTFGIEPERLDAYLRQRGLVLESDLGASDYRGRYFGVAARKMQGHEFYRVARACVPG